MSKWFISGFADEIDPSLDRQLEALAEFGVEWVELRAADGVNVSDFTPQKRREVREKLLAAGVRVSSIGSPIGKIALDEPFQPHMERLKRCLEVQKELGAPYLRMFSFYPPQGRRPEECRSQVLERLSALLEEAGRWDAVLLHENEKGIYGDTAPRCLDLMEALGGPRFRAVFDFANFLEVGQPTWEAYQKMRPYIQYIHIKDADGEKKIVPAGRGKGRVQDILADLAAAGWEGFLSLEPHLVDFAGLAALERDPQKRAAAMDGKTAWHTALTALRDILSTIPEAG